MRDWLEAHAGLLVLLTAASVLLGAAGLLASPWLAARIPADYFAGPRRRPAVGRGHPAWRVLWRIGKNLVGLFLLLLGAAMLVLPGPGVPTLLIGLVLVDFPGKYGIERWLAARRPVLRALDWLRARAGAPPLLAPQGGERRPPGARKPHLWPTLGLLAGPALALLLLSLPLDLPPPAARLAAVTVLMVVFWVTEAIPAPATALLGTGLAILLGVAPARQVMAAFGDPVVLMFIGSFMLAQAVRAHGLDQRIACGLLAHRWVAGGTRRILWTLGLTAWLLSMWISSTAAVMMLMPVALAIGRAQDRAAPEKAGNYAKGLLLMLVFATSAGSLATPVGTPPNLIALGLIAEELGTRVTFFQWLAFGLPLAALMLAASFAVLAWLFPPGARRPHGELDAARSRLRALGPWKTGETRTLAVFCATVGLWILPGILALALGAGHPWTLWCEERLPPGAVAVLAAAALFVLPTDWANRRFALRWQDASGIDWGTVLLFGGGIALGRMMSESGLAAALGRALAALVGSRGDAALLAAMVATAALIGQFCSTTATVAMAVPLALSFAQSDRVTLALAATLAAGTAGVFPAGSPTGAVVFSSGLLRLRDLALPGAVLCLIGCLAIWAAARWWIPMWVG